MRLPLIDVRFLNLFSSIRRAISPVPAAYENFADNHAYAMVKVSSSHDVTYENVIDPTVIDEEYEPIEPSAKPIETGVCYENVELQGRYENVDQAVHEPAGQPSYENLDQPSYENIDEGAVVDDSIDVDGGGTYENVVIREPANKVKPLEIVNVYEDVIPPPPKTVETEEIIYHQVKVLRQSIQEVNELLREDPTVLQIAIADLGEYPVRNVNPAPSHVKIRNSPAKETSQPESVASPKKKSPFSEAKPSGLVIKEIAVDDPPPNAAPSKGVRLSLSPKRMSTSEDSPKSEPATDPSRNGKDQHLPLSVSLPSLLNSNKVQQQKQTTAPATQQKNVSLPPTPLYDLYAESESVSSKRRFESEIGRDLLRERRIRNEIENSRRSESNLLQSSGQTSPSRRQSTSESSALIKPCGKPALPVKMNPKKTEPKIASPAKRPEVMVRPTTLETSFDYEPTPLQRRASSPPSSGSPLSPVSPTSEGRNFTSSGARKTSVKELLNKFQTGGDNNDRSQRVSTPTSPVKPASPASSPQKQQATEEAKKMKDGKENIEVHLSPSNPESCDMAVENSESCKTGEVMEHGDAKEQLRQKSLGIDMSDPRTRLRIERYKEERRSFLREKYKSESFRSDSKEDAVIVRLKQKAGSPTHQPESIEAGSPPPPSLQRPEPGLIDEDVNVKERAAQWAQTLPALTPPSPIKSPPSSAPTQRSCSEAVSIAPQHKRIRDMAALFEKETP